MLLNRSTVVIITLISILAIPGNLAISQSNIQIPLAREEITVTPWGTLQLTKTYRLVNFGNSTAQSMEIMLPKNAYDIAVRDDLGFISSKATDVDTGKNVTATFRYPLRGVVGVDVYNDAYMFSVTYTLPSSSYLTQPEFSSFRFDFNTSTGIGSPVNGFAVVVTLPEGSTFSSSSPSGQARMVGLSPVVAYSVVSLGPKQVFPIVLSYRFFPLWSAFRPTIWVGTIAAMGIAAFLLRRRYRGAEAREESLDTGLLRDFANALDEEIALWDDLEQLEQGLVNGNVGRKDYNRRRRILDERGRSLSSSLVRLKQEVRQFSPQYARVVERVEAAEAEMTTLRNDFSKMMAQFSAGRISRSSFEDSDESYRRRAGKIRAVIEPIIIELRSEAG